MAITFVQAANTCFGDSAVTNGGTSAFSSTNGLFASTDTSPAVDIWIKGAGAAGADYVGHMVTATPNNSCTVSPNTGTSVASGIWALGIGAVSVPATNKVTITFKNSVVAGNALFLGINTGPAITVSSVTDNLGNTWTACGAGISNADYFQRAYGVLGTLGGTCTVTVTFSSAPPNINTSLTLLEANAGLGMIWVQDQFATGNGTGNPVTGAFTTKYANELIVAFTGVANAVTAVGSGYTGNPTTSQNNGSAVQPIDMFADTMQYKIVSAIQSGVTSGVTQGAGGLYLITAVTFAAVPAPSAVYPDVGRGSSQTAAAHVFQTNVKPSVPVVGAPNPQASFPESGQLPWRGTDYVTNVKPSGVPGPQPLTNWPAFPDRGQSPGRYNGSDGWMANVRPAAPVAPPNPQASFPDAGQPYSGRVLEAGASTQSAILFSPSPQAVFPDAPYVGIRSPAAHVATTGYLKPQLQPNPGAVFPDRGNQVATPIADEMSQAVFPFAPLPFQSRAVYPDKGTQATNVQPPVPTAFLPNPALFQPNPGAIYPDKGNQLPNVQPIPPTSNLPNPATFQPAPRGVFPDKGTGRATDVWAHMDVSPHYFAPPPPPPNPEAVYADTGTQLEPIPTRHMFATGDPWIAPIPNVEAVFADRGTGYVTPPSAHLDSTRYPFAPPAPPRNPTASYPDVFEQQPPPATRHMFATRPAWIAPVPSPMAVYVDRPPAPFVPQHLDSTRYPFAPPVATPNPQAWYPDVGAQVPPPVTRHMSVSGLTFIAPVPKPMAVYPDRGQTPPPPQHLTSSGPPWIPPIVTPRAVFPDVGSGYLLPAHAHMATSTEAFAPPPYHPQAIYPDMPPSRHAGYLHPAIFAVVGAPVVIVGPIRTILAEYPSTMIVLVEILG